MSVGRICARVVATTTPEESAHEAAKRMKENNVGCLVVVDESRLPKGILTDRDIVTRVVALKLDATETPVSKIMTPQPRSVDESTPIEQAVATMRGMGIRRLVVTGERGLLVGVLSVDDVLELIAEEIESIGKLVQKGSPRIESSRKLEAGHTPQEIGSPPGAPSLPS